MGIGADATKKLECLVIAAEHDMLPVVHALPGGRVGECGRAAAERRPCLEDEHTHIPFGQRRGGTQPGKACADDDHVRTHDRGKSDLAQMRSAISARYGRGTRMRSRKTS